jgi:hypothetical protein
MKHCFALTSLTVALFAVATGCGPKKSLRAKKSKPVETVATSEAAAPSSAPPVAAAAAPTPAAAPVAIPVAPAGAGGASGSGMAVVILMLPADVARPGETAGAARTYKLSLSANTDTATIQVDGQPAVTAPVQRVYPTAPRAPAVATWRAPAVVAPRPASAPVRPRYLPQPPVAQREAGYDAPLDARQSRRGAITTAMRPPLPPPVIINPNGAPIID